MKQADLLFGPRPFDRFDVLLALSDEIASIGVEHHRSGEIARISGYFTRWNGAFPHRDSFPHEYVHGWNGKHRRASRHAGGLALAADDLHDQGPDHRGTCGAALAELAAQRGYYTEGALVWLDVDTRIRELTGDTRFPNDFSHAFLGSDGEVDEITDTYKFDDVVRMLVGVADYDWLYFFIDKLQNMCTGAPLAGVERGD